MATDAPPILVVGNTGDPITPIDGSQALAKALPGSVLLTSADSGHTAFGHGDDCIDLAVTAYLLNLTLPAPNTVCPA